MNSKKQIRDNKTNEKGRGIKEKMKSRKIIVILLILNMIMAIIISNLLINRGIKVEKQIIKEMTEGEYESKITELNTSHE